MTPKQSSQIYHGHLLTRHLAGLDNGQLAELCRSREAAESLAKALGTPALSGAEPAVRVLRSAAGYLETRLERGYQTWDGRLAAAAQLGLQARVGHDSEHHRRLEIDGWQS